jgi:threonine dehydratase
VALAASLAGTSSVILMPEDAPPTKVAATRGYGAEVVTYDRYTGDRTAIAQQLAKDRGVTLIPPYDHYDVMAGQGTVALELIEEVGPLSALLVPIGGGGLMAGCATAAIALSPGIRMIGVEPAAGDDTARSLAAGERVEIGVPRTIADGQAIPIPGELTFAINQQLLDSVELVSDDEIRTAMAFAFERLKIVLEPSGASALAALLAGRIEGRPERIGVVLSGGNVGLERFHELLA